MVLFYEPDPEGDENTVCVAIATVDVEGAPPLVVTLENWSTKLSKWLGFVREVEVGDTGFDDRFLLRTPSPTKALKQLASDRPRRAIEALFDRFRCYRLELFKRGVRAKVRAHPLLPATRRALVAHLDRIADAFDRRAIHVTVLGGDRRALAVKGAARCAFCHGEVTGRELDLVACRRCATIAHDECWRELGHCPTLGCPGKSPERGRRR
jgi:hypothetical protein